ncbi:hypothetical protein SLS60_002786 [Paraconiothyrium brasiliense]|uniref:Collagen-like protein n=1 Tax=Paraconiothyrium brasiliense TaxID=300254 RepID=A0ABR3RUA7_9PLEO
MPPVPLAIPNLSTILPKLPVVDTLPPLGTGLPKIPLPDLPLPAIVSAVPAVPAVPLATTDDSVDSYVKVGKIVLSNILNLLWKGASAAKIPGLDLTSTTVPVPAVPVVPVVNTTLPAVVALPTLQRRQAAPSSSATATPAAGLPLLGGLTGGLTGGLGGLTSGLTGGSSPLGTVASTVGGTTGSLPLVGGLTSGLTSGLPAVGGVTGTVGGLTSSLPAVGGLTGGLTGGSSPLAAVGGLTGSLPVVGGVTSGLTGGSSPLGAVSGLTGGLTGGSSPLGAVGGVAGTVANTVGSLPVVGGAVAPVAGAVGGLTSGSPLGAVGSTGVVNTANGLVNSVLPGPYPLDQGVPGSDPVGGLSISIIATLLSLLKKDPLSLFGGLGGASALVKRDLPELADAFEIERRQLTHHEKRQLSLPSLSSGLPGVGVGGLPLSGIPGVSPDLSFLVGSIAKNIAVPGGKGLGSVTGNILSVLNGIVPNFLFKLPVVQDSVPTFGCLQLLASINPTKFGTLADLTNLAALSNAASGISASDLAFIRTLPASTDPSNLITTITALTDNILSLPGNVANLRAAVSVLCLKNLGLAVPGL